MRISLCILSYKRQTMLRQCLRSVLDTKTQPLQIIVNSDGGDEENRLYLLDMFDRKAISNLILNNGENRGVGRAFANCLAIAEGDLFVKVDSDLIFQPGWQHAMVSVMTDNPDIGALSLFDYRHYDPNDTRFKVEYERTDCYIVNDFVSSIYAFRANDLAKIYPVTDDGNHGKFGQMAITKCDYVKNQGFGVGKSVYVSGTVEHPFKTPTFSQPYRL